MFQVEIADNFAYDIYTENQKNLYTVVCIPACFLLCTTYNSQLQ